LEFKANIKETNNSKYGDYQFDACIQISRHLASQNTKITPQEVAKTIVENLEKIKLIEKVDLRRNVN
jgi:arginyl-tRNA synthetase